MVLRKAINLKIMSVGVRTFSDTIPNNLSKAMGPSANVVTIPSKEVGPGASKEGKYKNPEYFCYSDMSYFNADKEMLKFRLPQPSPKN